MRAAVLIARGDHHGALRDQLRSFELESSKQAPFRWLGALASTSAIYAELERMD